MHTKFTLFFWLFLNGLVTSTTVMASCKAGNMQNKYVEYSDELQLTIVVYQNTARIMVPEDNDIRIGWGNQIRINVAIKQVVFPTNVKDLELKVGPSFTTLVPVKIPPPSSSNSKQKNNGMGFCIILEADEYPDEPGNHDITFEIGSYTVTNEDINCYNDLQNGNCYMYNNFYGCNTSNVPPFDKKTIEFTMYDYVNYTITDPEIRTTEGEGIQLGFCPYNNSTSFSTYNYYVSSGIYLSEDDKIDEDDILVDRMFSEPGYFGDGEEAEETECLQTLLTNDFLTTHKGQYLICMVDRENRAIEIDENDNSKVVPILPDIQLTDIRMYERTDSWIEISTTVTNSGNTILDSSTLDFYVENYPRQFIGRRTIPSLLPGASSTIAMLVTRQFYNIRLSSRDLILVVDPDQEVKELDETNNEKRFRVPRLVGAQTFVKVSPNPIDSFDNEVYFDFSVNRTDAEVKLSVYDPMGNLVYQTNDTFPEKGDQQIVVPTDIFNSSGVYQFSFLIGWNHHYFPFTGGIVKK